jgi:predicted amidohydrolase YtcJ
MTARVTVTTVLRGARIGRGGPRADVVVGNGKVLAVEPAGSTQPTGAEVVHLRDATVLPGLVDAHVHVDQWVHRLHRVDVSTARTAGQVVDLLRDAPHDGRGARVLTGHGFVDGLWPEPAHRHLLDVAFGKQPVAVVSADLHAVWLNGPALEVVGAAGHPTGVIREQACMEALRALMAVEPEEVVDGWVADALGDVATRGVTGLVDFEYADNIGAWRRRGRDRELPVRIAASVWLPWLDAAVATGLHTGDPLPDTAGMVTMGPFKLMADGSLNTRTAFCHDAYPGDDGAEPYGLELLATEEIVAHLTRATEAGLVPAVHAIGDAANTSALDAFEKVGCHGTIEHAQLVRTEDLPRFAAAGVIASIQPHHAVVDRDVADRHWSGRTGRAFAFADLHAAGAEFRLGSDAPVSPPDPWLALAAAVHRTGDNRPPWHPEQTLPLDVALAAACGGRRRPKVGDPADLTVVEGDLEDVGPAELRATTVLATMVAGRFSHRTVP